MSLCYSGALSGNQCPGEWERLWKHIYPQFHKAILCNVSNRLRGATTLVSYYASRVESGGQAHRLVTIKVMQQLLIKNSVMVMDQENCDLRKLVA